MSKGDDIYTAAADAALRECEVTLPFALARDLEQLLSLCEYLAEMVTAADRRQTNPDVDDMLETATEIGAYVLSSDLESQRINLKRSLAETRQRILNDVHARIDGTGARRQIEV